MTERLTIFARITPKTEYFEDARQAVLDIISATLAEPGCHTFTLHEDAEARQRLYLYEIWENESALSAHHEQSYTQAVFDSYREWLSEPVEITVLRQLGGGLQCSS